MKQFTRSFVLRGLMTACGGPIVLAIIYGALGASGAAEALSPAEVCRGILSITVMAFVAGGITTIYQAERLPVAMAALIHGGVLYLDYLLMYLLNSWIPRNGEGIGLFTAIFAAGYALIWLGIYLVNRKKAQLATEKLHTQA